MLPIDHVLLPVGWSGGKELRPELGSDHRGVVVRVSRGG
jgi:endonuclease/exonuclease/phosphatase (EEP) superfamily protein YafD